jgi:predicted DsbA family dithiol-disulfide isomerase
MKESIIELFYSPLCSTCPKAKDIAREVAEKRGILLEEINVLSTDGQRRSESYKIKSVPYIVVNRKSHISGVPSKERLEELLKEKNGNL